MVSYYNLHDDVILRRIMSIMLLILGILEVVITLIMTFHEISDVNIVLHILIGDAILVLLGIHLGLNWNAIKSYIFS